MKSLAQISKDYNIPTSTLRSAIEDGRLWAQKIGRDWIIDTTNPTFKQFLEKYRPKEEKK